MNGHIRTRSASLLMQKNSLVDDRPSGTILVIETSPGMGPLS